MRQLGIRKKEVNMTDLDQINEQLKDGFDAQLSDKLNSGRYNLSKIIRETKISRYWLNDIKRNVYVPPYIIVALNEYFRKLGE
jgi:hypothetical protein